MSRSYSEPRATSMVTRRTAFLVATGGTTRSRIRESSSIVIVDSLACRESGGQKVDVPKRQITSAK